MTDPVHARLLELGITLPQAAPPQANYLPFVRSGSLLFIAGQIPIAAGEVRYRGLVGAELSVEEGAAAARLCAINCLAQASLALDGALARISRVVRLGGFVACTPAFTEQPAVVNGASDLMVEAFGEAGRHARAAVGCAALPLGSAVEVEALFEVAE